MKVISCVLFGAVLSVLANTTLAQIGGIPGTFGCKGDAERNALTIACAGLQASEQGCPSDYTVDGQFCLARDPSAEHQTVVRNTCPDGLEFQGNKCVRLEELHHNAL